MNLIEYAQAELSRLESDCMQNQMNKNIMELITTFSNQGHSALSAVYLIDKLTRLMKWKPIQQLTGEDCEWEHCYDKEDGTKCYQNKRCSSLFKEVTPDGKIRCRDTDSVACSDNGGITWFSGSTTRQWEEDITFPYYPPTDPRKVYIEYTEEVPLGFTGDKFDVITNDKERIKALYRRKRKEFDEAEE